MTQLTPFLLFDGDCAEAMAFYGSCLGGEVTLVRLADTPMAAGAPEEHLERITYAHVRSDAVELSGADWLHPTRRPAPGNTVGLYVTAASSEELRSIFEPLSVGAAASLLDPLREMPFGTYGHLADRFGVHWFFRSES